MAQFIIPVKDYSKDDAVTSISVRVDDAISDANLTVLFNAFDGVSIGAFGQSILKSEVEKDAGPGGASADNSATVKLKYLCRAVDNVTLEKFEREIPAPNHALLTANSDFVDLGAGDGLAFKTDWDANIKSNDGNASTLQSVELRGRNRKRKK